MLKNLIQAVCVVCAIFGCPVFTHAQQGRSTPPERIAKTGFIQQLRSLTEEAKGMLLPNRADDRQAPSRRSYGKSASPESTGGSAFDSEADAPWSDRLTDATVANHVEPPRRPAVTNASRSIPHPVPDPSKSKTSPPVSDGLPSERSTSNSRSVAAADQGPTRTETSIGTSARARAELFGKVHVETQLPEAVRESMRDGTQPRTKYLAPKTDRSSAQGDDGDEKGFIVDKRNFASAESQTAPRAETENEPPQVSRIPLPSTRPDAMASAKTNASGDRPLVAQVTKPSGQASASTASQPALPATLRPAGQIAPHAPSLGASQTAPNQVAAGVSQRVPSQVAPGPTMARTDPRGLSSSQSAESQAPKKTHAGIPTQLVATPSADGVQSKLASQTTERQSPTSSASATLFGMSNSNGQPDLEANLPGGLSFDSLPKQGIAPATVVPLAQQSAAAAQTGDRALMLPLGNSSLPSLAQSLPQNNPTNAGSDPSTEASDPSILAMPALQTPTRITSPLDTAPPSIPLAGEPSTTAPALDPLPSLIAPSSDQLPSNESELRLPMAVSQATPQSPSTALTDGSSASSLRRPEAFESTARLKLETPRVGVVLNGPSDLTVGKPTRFEVVASNLDGLDLTGLILRLEIPKGIAATAGKPDRGDMQLERTEDGATLLTWMFEKLGSGESATAPVEITAATPRNFAVAMEWTLMPLTGSATVGVLAPQLDLALEGPSEVMHGEKNTYRLLVRNPGNATAENVSVQLTAGPYGESTAEVGDIPAGGVETIDVDLTFNERGAIQIKADATASAGLSSATEIGVLVKQPQLTASLDGPELVYHGAASEFQVTLSNQGDADARNVQATFSLPPGATLASLPEGLTMVQGQVQWQLPLLQAGATASNQLQLVLVQEGDNRLDVQCSLANGQSTTCSVVTQVQAIVDLKLLVNDPIAPAPVGSESLYELLLTNRGSKAANNVRVIAQFSEGIEPIRGAGYDFRIVPGQLFFNPIERIEAGQQLKLQVYAKASVGGMHRFRAEVRSDDSELKLAQEVSTQYLEVRRASAPTIEKAR